MKQSFFIISLTTLALAAPIFAVAQDVAGDATTTFEANKSTLTPKDPEEDKDIVPIYPPTPGPLSINYASSVNFGKQKVTASERTFYASADTLTKTETGATRQSPNFVQVTDLRGTGTGWTLSVRQNGPLKNEKGTTLSGAKLSVSAVSVKSQYGEADIVTDMPERVLDETGSKQAIITTPEESGMGTWNVYLGAESDPTKAFKLVVPKDQPKESGKYTTSLTWVLEDVL